MNFLVIGELCMDIFLYGRSDRLSPEAPVPVFLPLHREITPGMAANVERNLKALINKYPGKHDVDSILSISKAMKIRYVDSKTNHYFLRVDENDDTHEMFKIDKRGKLLIENADAIIISDYCKGFLTLENIFDISNLRKKGCVLFLDTKKQISKDLLDAVDFLKINQKEYEENFKYKKMKSLHKKVIVTLGQEGAMYENKKYPPSQKLITMDVSGAGDTFMASFAFQYIISNNIELAISFANEISGEVVSKRGVSTI